MLTTFPPLHLVSVREREILSQNLLSCVTGSMWSMGRRKNKLSGAIPLTKSKSFFLLQNEISRYLKHVDVVFALFDIIFVLL